MAMGQFVLVAEFVARLDAVKEVQDLLLEYSRIVRSEPGNIMFVCHQVQDTPEKFLVYEVYKDQLAFDEHIASRENSSFNLKLATRIDADGVRLTFLSRLNLLRS
jgi:quinol monooxygenase YgiN